MEGIDVLIGLILSISIGTIAYTIKFVDITGFITSIIIGFIIWYTGGLIFFVSVLTVLILVGIATKYEYNRKRDMGVAQELNGRRGWKNILSSGMVPMLFSILVFLNSGDIQFLFIMAFIGSLATVFSDTMASELGVLSKRKPRLITSPLKKAFRGTAGAVSLFGEGIAILSCLIIGIFVMILSSIYGIFSLNMNHIALILPASIIGGMIGCNTDSLMGATLQCTYECNVCHKNTGEKVHCGYETEYVSGFKWFNNISVNLSSSLIGGIIVIILFTSIILIIILMSVWIAGSFTNS